MYSVQGLDQDTVNAVLDEFLAIIKAQTSLGMGAGNYIRNVMNKALGEDKAQSVLSRIAPSTAARPIEILDWMDARSIAELIIDEHPQIIALIISYLDADRQLMCLVCCQMHCSLKLSVGLQLCRQLALTLCQSWKMSCSPNSRLILIAGSKGWRC